MKRGFRKKNGLNRLAFIRDSTLVLYHIKCVCCFCFFMMVSVLPCRLGEIQVALIGQGTAAARAALPIPISACSIFLCPDNGMAASVWDF